MLRISVSYSLTHFPYKYKAPASAANAANVDLFLMETQDAPIIKFQRYFQIAYHTEQKNVPAQYGQKEQNFHQVIDS